LDVLECRFVYKEKNVNYILMEDKSTLKNRSSEGIDYDVMREEIILAEKQRRELGVQYGFRDCKLNYEHIWS